MLTYYEKRIQYSTNEYIATDSFDLNTNKKFLEKLYDALRTDILNDNNYYINEHAARYGNLSELSDVRYMVLTLTEYSGYQKTIIIPDDYTNTTECIKKYFKIQ